MTRLYRLNEIGLDVPSGARVLKAATSGALDEADVIVEAARARAADIIADSEAVYEARKSDGYRDGLAAAAQEALAQVVAEQAHLDAALKDLENRLSTLVVDCVAAILGEADQVDLAEKMTRAALTKMRREERAQLFVPFELVVPLRERVDAILAPFPEVELLDVVGDGSLSPPTVVLQSALGRVRCNLDEAVASLDAMIRDTLADLAVTSHGSGAVPGAIHVNPAPPEEDAS